jgi:hypothetical protein
VEQEKDTRVAVTLVKGEPGTEPPETPGEEAGSPEKPAATGSISFATTPPGSGITPDGFLIGQQTHCTIDTVEAGPHTVIFVLGDQISTVQPVTVIGGERATVTFAFPGVPGVSQPGTTGAASGPGAGAGPDAGSQAGSSGTGQNGLLSVETIPSGAVVYIDDEQIGKTPVRDLEKKPGSYTISFLKNGYRQEIITTVVLQNGYRMISRSLTPITGTKPTGLTIDELETLKVIPIPDNAEVFIESKS